MFENNCNAIRSGAKWKYVPRKPEQNYLEAAEQ